MTKRRAAFVWTMEPCATDERLIARRVLGLRVLAAKRPGIAAPVTPDPCFLPRGSGEIRFQKGPYPPDTDGPASYFIAMLAALSGSSSPKQRW